MTNGRHVRVGPRHPLDTAACVSAQYLPGNFFSLNWDMTQTWSGHGRDTMSKRIFLKKKKKRKKAWICMITTVNRGLNSTRSLLFSQTCMITAIDLPETSFSLSLFGRGPCCLPALDWQRVTQLQPRHMSSVMETHWLVSDPLSLARICQLFHTLSLSLSLSFKKFQKQNQCNSFCFYSRSRTSEVVVSSG